MERLSGYLFFIYECAGILVTSTCITQWVLATPTLTMPWISLMFEFYLNHSHYKISQLSQCHHETHSFSCDLMVSWWRPHFSQSTVHEHDRLSLVTRQELGFGNAKMSQFGILRKKRPQECLFTSPFTDNSHSTVGQALRFQAFRAENDASLCVVGRPAPFSGDAIDHTHISRQTSVAS